MVPTISPDFEYKLQDCFYKYYKADAFTRAYTRHVLCMITGDPDFDFWFVPYKTAQHALKQQHKTKLLTQCVLTINPIKKVSSHANPL